MRRAPLHRDYLLPTVPRPYRLGTLHSWWFRPIACSLLLGDRATALELIREATSPAIDALAPAARYVPETEYEIGFTADRAQAQTALRLRLRLDSRMAPWRNDPEIVAMIGETPTKP